MHCAKCGMPVVKDFSGWMHKLPPMSAGERRKYRHVVAPRAEDVGQDENEGGITPEGQALGHRYIMGNVNAYCPKCSEEQGVCVLDCDYDLDK